MAIYEYYCAHCATIVEINHSVFDTPEVLCDTCKEPRTKKFGVGAVTFKGSGWGHSTN